MATNPKIDTNDPAQVERARAPVVQQLQEAHATERALVTNLRAHIAMTPRGPYEGRHRRRVEVLEAASRQLSNSGSSS
jgi:hypothetical protein